MEPTRFADGEVTLNFPDQIIVRRASSGGTRRGATLPTKGKVSMPGRSDLNDDLISILTKNGLDLVDQVDLEPAANTSTRSARTAQEASGNVNVAVQSDEDAVLLMEQDGMYTWKYADKVSSVERAATRTRSAAIIKELRFTISFPKTSPEEHARKRDISEKISSFVWGRVRIYVLKFLAKVTVGKVRDHLERDVEEGIVLIKDISPDKWTLHPYDQPPVLNPPSDRPAKILFLIHGTFSSTAGAFGALGGTPWGIDFLKSSLQYYDAVIGFNHFTLRKDPLENAQKIFHCLTELKITPQARVDVVTHSRGALVTRCLAEKLLPGTALKDVINKVVFVGSTNEGTLLASPANWDDLVTLYTNLAVGVSKALGIIMPQSKAVTVVLSEIIKSIGSFVKYCATSAITDKVIPGLAAMEPTGDFVKDINLKQEGQRTIEDTNYYAITSAFKPRLGDETEPKEFSKRLVQMLASGFITRLMDESNDLVVNVASMTSIDKEFGRYVRDQFNFPENSQVYHTNYFTRPEVVNAMVRWLNLPAPLEVEVKRTTRVRTIGTAKVSTTFPVLYQFDEEKPLPSFVDVNIISFESDAKADLLLSQIDDNSPSYVVIQRWDDKKKNYAFSSELILEEFGKSAIGNRTIGDVLRLDKSSVWEMHDLSKSKDIKRKISVVVLDDEKPVGVIPPATDFPDVEQLAKLASAI